MKKLLLSIILSTAALYAQTAPVNPQSEGIWEGYDGEWDHVSRQLLALAEAIPADKYSWRPGPGVRSVSEVLVHIAQANFYLLSVTGPKMPADIQHEDLEKTVTAKPLVIADLKRSLDAVRTARSHLRPGGAPFLAFDCLKVGRPQTRARLVSEYTMALVFLSCQEWRLASRQSCFP